MPQRVLFNEELGIIEVISTGIVTHQDLQSSLQRIKAISEETGTDKVLVDTTGEEELPAVLDLDDFGATLPGSLKFAILVAEAQPTAKKAEFVRSTASIRGALMRTFASREDALEWLDQ